MACGSFTAKPEFSLRKLSLRRAGSDTENLSDVIMHQCGCWDITHGRILSQHTGLEARKHQDNTA